MSSPDFSKSVLPKTALVIVDTYNDFLHPTRKPRGLFKESLTTTNAIIHVKELVSAARRYRIPILYTLFQTSEEESCGDWQRTDATSTQKTGPTTVEEGRWGAEIFEGLKPDLLEEREMVVLGYSNKSDSGKAELDHQLKKREIKHILIAGVVVGTCIEAAGRYSWELGYRITLLTDAIAGYLNEQTDLAAKLMGPLITDEIKTVGDWISSLEEAECKVDRGSVSTRKK